MSYREPMTCPLATRHPAHDWTAPMRGGPVDAYCDGTPTTPEPDTCNPPCGDPLCPCARKPGYAATAPTGTLNTLLGAPTWRTGDDT